MGLLMQQIFKISVLFSLLILTSCVTTTTQLTSGQGIKNKINFYPSQLPNSPAVLILPGRSNTPYHYENLALKMSNAGINAILVSYNYGGHSRWNQELSKNRGGTEGLVNNEVATALNFLKLQKSVDKDRIGVLGGSMGTWVGLQTMSKFKELKSLAMLSPICAVKGKSFETFPGTKILAEDFGDRHLLLVASENDRHSKKFPTATEKSDYLSSIMPNAKIEKKYYPGKSHSFYMLNDHPELNNLLVEWFKKTL